MARTALRVLALAALGVAALGLPRAAPAQDRAWNQEAATALARELADSANTFYQQVRSQPYDQSLVPIYKSEMDLVELNARLLAERARGLATSLADGKDRAETQGNYETVDTTLRDVSEHARSEWIPERLYRTWSGLARTHVALGDYYEDHHVHRQLEGVRVEPPR